MEGVLARLLLPDSAQIAAATADLRTAFKQVRILFKERGKLGSLYKARSLQPGAIAELCGVLSTSQQPQVRQYAAVLLRYVALFG